jgi:hypothetical protein
VFSDETKIKVKYKKVIILCAKRKKRKIPRRFAAAYWVKTEENSSTPVE